MHTRTHDYIRPTDIHAAIARAHSDRAEYIRIALLGVPALVKRVAAKVRPNRHRLPRAGAWA